LIKQEKNIGILGGTFNPVHYGHLRAAIDVYDVLSLDELIFIPTLIPPHKEENSILSFYHRFNMLKLATKSVPYFKISDMEAQRGGKSYSVETIAEIKKQINISANLFFIIGMDGLLEIHLWKDYKRLFSLCNMTVIERPGFLSEEIADILKNRVDSGYVENGNSFVHPDKKTVILLKGTKHLDISSSSIRKYVKEGKSIKFLLPIEVEDYILREKLYKE